MKIWEYAALYINISNEDWANAAKIVDLNRYGAEGWELISVNIDSSGGWRYTFKRLKK